MYAYTSESKCNIKLYTVAETTHSLLKSSSLCILLVLLNFALSARLAIIIYPPSRFIVAMNGTCACDMWGYVSITMLHIITKLFLRLIVWDVCVSP